MIWSPLMVVRPYLVRDGRGDRTVSVTFLVLVINLYGEHGEWVRVHSANQSPRTTRILVWSQWFLTDGALQATDVSRSCVILRCMVISMCIRTYADVIGPDRAMILGICTSRCMAETFLRWRTSGAIR